MKRLKRLQEAAGVRILEVYACYRVYLYAASYYLVPAMRSCLNGKHDVVVRIYTTLCYVAVCLFMAWLCKSKGSVYIRTKTLSAGRVGALFTVVYFACSVGSLLGKGIVAAAGFFDGTIYTAQPEAPGLTLFEVAHTVILAPVLEELIFRKALCGRLLPYGKLVAAVVSGMSFGFFHGDPMAFFYASAAGIVFSLVYLETGNVGYAILLHAMINGFDCMREHLWLSGWGSVTNILAILTGICGAVTSFLYLRKKRRWPAVLLNAFWSALQIPGMWLFLLVATAEMVKNR